MRAGARTRSKRTEAGDRVRFQISDVFLPSPGNVLSTSCDETELEGRILGFSDSGQVARYFAVIEVVRTQSLIVPVQKLEAVKEPEQEENS